jgi:hypothetical protein
VLVRTRQPTLQLQGAAALTVAEKASIPQLAVACGHGHHHPPVDTDRATGHGMQRWRRFPVVN